MTLLVESIHLIISKVDLQTDLCVHMSVISCIECIVPTICKAVEPIHRSMYVQLSLIDSSVLLSNFFGVLSTGM